MTDTLQELNKLLEVVSMSSNNNNNTPELQYALAFQGGAGNISTAAQAKNAETRVQLFHELKKILKYANKYCQRGLMGELTALDIVEKVVLLMENSPMFNCGKGSVFNKSGKHEMEASLMNGNDLKCGAVSGITNIKNQISIARDIMETTKHVYLIGNGATQHIQHLLLDTQHKNYYESSKRSPPSFESEEYFWTKRRWDHYQKVKQRNELELSNRTMRSEDEEKLNDLKHDGMDDIFEGNTVGCVVMLKGNVASATSTGGMTYKMNGRVGDTPIIGAGTYADNKWGAISCTGTGEEFMRHVTAYDVIARVKYCGVSLQRALDDHLKECFEVGTGGAVSVDRKGNFGIEFNTTGMLRGYFTSDDKCGYVAVLRDDTQSVSFDDFQISQ